MQIPVGIYLDSMGPRFLMTTLSLVAAAGAIVFACGESAVVLIVGRILLGVGMACNLMGPLKLITAWFSPLYFATLSAIFVSVGTAGNIVATTPLVWLTELFGWRTTFLLFSVINLFIAILFYLVARDHPDNSPASRPKTDTTTNLSVALSGIAQLFSRRDYWLISIGTFFRYGIYASVQALWAGPLLMAAIGLSPYMTGINFFTMIGVAFFLHGLGWVIKEFFPRGSPEPEIFRVAFVFFGVSLVLTALLYGLTVDVKKDH